FFFLKLNFLFLFMSKKLIEIEKQVVLVGHGGSGKTCILHRVFSKKFEEKYTPTVFEDTKHTRIIKNQQITLLILDTAGQDDYGRMIEINLNDADLVIFCYAVDCRNSFETLFSDYFSLLGDKTNKLIFLVGCKTDTREFQQVVSYEEGKALA
ncbi:rho-related GTP-binding protein, partial [Tubulinosema ratisbonensis]